VCEMNVPDTRRAAHSRAHAMRAPVLKKEEEALITLMKERAVTHCGEAQRAYYECVKGRTLSVAWACRDAARAMSACLSAHTSEATLERMKRRWVDAGKPSIADRSRPPRCFD